MDEKDLCAKCWAEISPNALFCSSCGQVHINNQIIPTKTTAEYDPGNKQRKPWREPVPTANNSWKDKNIKDNIPNYIPWKPVMNQSKVYVKRVKGKPSRLPLPEDCLDNSGSPAASKETESARRQFERLNSKRVLLFRGRLWSKSGNSYRKKKTIFNPDMIYGYEPKLDRYEDDQSSKESIAPVSFFPLGIYSVDWVCDQERSMCIHITLLRRSFRSKYNHNLSTFWLRIGCEIENPSIGEDNDGADQGREFCVLDYLPNCLAKCMGATMQGGWVDLKYIDPTHSYMIEHLQTALNPIADRVVPTSMYADTIFDQNCRIVMETFGEKYQEEEDSFVSQKEGRLGKFPAVLARVHSMVEESISDDEQSAGVGADSGSSNLQGKELKFDSFIAKISVGIPVGAYYLNRKVMSIVYLDVIWRHDPNDDILTADTYQEDSSSDDEVKSEASSNIPKPQKSSDWLTQVPVIEGVSLRIYPTYYNGQLLRPKTITINVDSLCDLLFPDRKFNYRDGDEEDSILLFGENTNPASQYILRLLEQGACGARKLCYEIVSVLRFEYTTSGLRLVCTGVDTIYTFCDTPEQIERRIETQNSSVIRIQSAWRGKLGRLKAQKVRGDRDYLLQLQRTHAVIQIQRVARGYLARRRYFAILDALAEQKKGLERQPSFPPQRVDTPERSTECQVTPHIVKINRTDVEITISPDSEQISTKGFQDCVVTITDLISRRSVSTLIPSTSLSRIWNNFRRLPLQFNEALVCIHSVKLAGVKQVDLIGKNDPFVILSYGDDWKMETSVIEEGGADVEWKYSDQETELPHFPITAHEIYDKVLHVRVYDANQYRSHTLIGEVDINITPLSSLTAYHEEYLITREIKNKGKVTGCISLVCSLQRIKEGSAESPDAALVVSKSSIHSLSELFSVASLLNEFLSYLAEKHLDLFLSRANDVMVLRKLELLVPRLPGRVPFYCGVVGEVSVSVNNWRVLLLSKYLTASASRRKADNDTVNLEQTSKSKKLFNHHICY